MKRKYLTLLFVFIAVIVSTLIYEDINDIENAEYTAFIFFIGLILFSIIIFFDIKRDRKTKLQYESATDPEEAIDSIVDDATDIVDSIDIDVL